MYVSISGTTGENETVLPRSPSNAVHGGLGLELIDFVPHLGLHLLPNVNILIKAASRNHALVFRMGPLHLPNRSSMSIELKIEELR